MGERCSDPEKALSLLSKAISLDPRYAEAYLRRGLAKSELGEGEEAFEDVTAGIRLQPTAQGYAYRGLVSLRSGQKNAAEKDLRHSLKLDPKQHLAHNYLGTLALSENNQAKACASFKEGCAQGDCSFLETSKKEGICP